MQRLFQRLSIVTLASLLWLSSLNHPMRAQQAGAGEIVIPFTLTDQNNIVVGALLNGTDPLKLMLHTASSDLRLTEDAVRNARSIKFTATDKVKSWGGESDSRTSKGNRLQIGELKRDNIDIWEDKNSGKDTDGKFGLDFFDKRIVEIDFDQQRLTLHAKLPPKAERFARLKIDNKNGMPMVQGNCLIEGKAFTNQFLLHSGYSGGILLDDAFAVKAGVDGRIKITDESSLKDSFGNTIKVKKGSLPEFVLGSAKLANVPVGFFSGGLGAQKMSIIGGEVLKQFNLIFDLANNDLYLAQRQVSK